MSNNIIKPALNYKISKIKNSTMIKIISMTNIILDNLISLCIGLKLRRKAQWIMQSYFLNLSYFQP